MLQQGSGELAFVGQKWQQEETERWCGDSDTGSNAI